MKKIGILGGMSPESTTLYYEHITRTYTAQHGDYGPAFGPLECWGPCSRCGSGSSAMDLSDRGRGEVRPDSRRRFLEIIEHLRERGAQGIVLGCTEIPLLLEPQHCDLPLFNTALLHAGKALAFAVQSER
jgi:aspartate/glutamate racemase